MSRSGKTENSADPGEKLKQCMTEWYQVFLKVVEQTGLSTEILVEIIYKRQIDPQISSPSLLKWRTATPIQKTRRVLSRVCTRGLKKYGIYATLRMEAH